MSKVVRLLAVAAVLGLVASAGVRPALACNPTVTMSQVDRALSATGLKGGKLADANALRDDLAEALQRNDQHRAHMVETSLMGLMGYVEDRPVSRDGCTRSWSRKN